MTEEKKIWFPIKRYGWGWGPPCCWQGWVVLLIYIALVIAAAWLVPPNEMPTHYTAYVTGLTVILIVICLLKGGRPRWRWRK
jgi:hypothetical protein